MPTGATCLADIQVPLGANIQTYLNTHPQGTSFCLAAGRYRVTQNLTPKAGQRISGHASETVVSGAKVLTTWTFDAGGARWYHEGCTPQAPAFFACPDSTPGDGINACCADGTDACMYPDDVYRNDVRLIRVLALDALAPGKVHVDYAQNRLYVMDDPTTAMMELAVTPTLFNDGPAGVTLSHFVVEKFGGANWGSGPAPAVRLLEDWLVDDVEARWNHGQGFHLGGGNAGMVLSNCKSHHNGQMGLAVSNADHGSILNCEIAYNNTIGFNLYWEAGGFKIAGSRDMLVSGTHSHHNVGPGMWTDIDNLRTTYDGNTVEDNVGEGIMHEISYDAVITNNLVRRNGMHGIYIAQSGGLGEGIIDVSSNTVEDNALGGITLIQSSRGSGSYGAYLVRNVRVQNNHVSACSAAQGIVGIYQYPGSPGDPFADGNTFEDNHYRVIGSTANWWGWQGVLRTWGQWNGLGHDDTGTMLMDASCPLLRDGFE